MSSATLEHVGVKGMRWGVRRTPAEQKQRAKEKAVKKSDKAKYKLESRLSAGEVVASALVAGPIGVIGYKTIKRHAAETKLENKNLSAQKQKEAAAKVSLGKAAAVTLLTGPVGLLSYTVAKEAASRQVDDF
jgi:hypothetical protein